MSYGKFYIEFATVVNLYFRNFMRKRKKKDIIKVEKGKKKKNIKRITCVTWKIILQKF